MSTTLEILALTSERPPPRNFAEFQELLASEGARSPAVDEPDWWGCPYYLEVEDLTVPCEMRFILRSAGPDETPYTTDDITVSVSLRWKALERE